MNPKTAKRDSLLETIAIYDQLGAKYADRIAHIKHPELPEFISMLPSGARVLDVGCAAGRDSAILRDARFKVVGIDLSQNFLELAQERVPGVEFLRMDARALCLKDNIFDGVWINAMLLNLDYSEVPGVLQGLRKTIKSGGICFVGVKMGDGEKFVGEALVDNMKRRETYFGKFEIEELLIDGGFKIIRACIDGDPLGRSKTKWLYVFARKHT